jgi:hypothetical protein
MIEVTYQSVSSLRLNVLPVSEFLVWAKSFHVFFFF